MTKDVNQVFAKEWEAKTGEKVTIEQSHGDGATSGFRRVLLNKKRRAAGGAAL